MVAVLSSHDPGTSTCTIVKLRRKLERSSAQTPQLAVSRCESALMSPDQDSLLLAYLVMSFCNVICTQVGVSMGSGRSWTDQWPPNCWDAQEEHMDCTRERQASQEYIARNFVMHSFCIVL